MDKVLDIKKNQIRAIEVFDFEHNGHPVFYDYLGYPVYDGQHVEFQIEGRIFPSTGAIQGKHEPKIACFDMLAYRWNYYTIKMEGK